MALKRHDLKSAEQEVTAYRKVHGATPEVLEALSWVARGALEAGDTAKAEAYAGEIRKLAKPTGDRRLELALGSAIEVHSAVLASNGERSEALRFLSGELRAYGGTPIEARIRKNINLLTLEGKPAPRLDVSQWIGTRPKPLAGYRGHPVLLFFWAHWCPDCKDETPVIAKIRERFGPRGLVVLGPTQHYGYVARGEEASPAEETRYIEKVWNTAYLALNGVPVPLGEDNFRVYGSSTVPTEVLIDRNGIVRLYHPDVMPYDELESSVEKVMSK
jgi:thiol-disulfide isomerase/thioredoxin